MRLSLFLLALGEDRFQSRTPHLLHPLLGRPLLAHTMAAVEAVAETTPPALLTDAPRAEPLRHWSQGRFPVLTEETALPPLAERILFVRAELPLLRTESLHALLDALEQGRPAALLVSQPSALPLALAVRREAVRLTTPWSHNPSDWVMSGTPTLVLQAEEDEGRAVCDRVAFAIALAALRARVNERWMREGVTLLDPQSTTIEVDVRIGRDTVIYPNTHLHGETVIGEACRIGPNTIIRDCRIGDRCRVLASVLEEAVMEEESDIGPFGHLRRGARLCRGAHMGNFGEMKNSTLGPGAKMGHFGYLGDAEIGADVNIGAGTITCNYDGERKHPTVIEAGAFIGSDTLLVAPVRVGREAKTGAGSVVTRDVPPRTLAYGVPARVRRSLDANHSEEPQMEKGEGGQ